MSSRISWTFPRFVLIYIIARVKNYMWPRLVGLCTFFKFWNIYIFLHIARIFGKIWQLIAVEFFFLNSPFITLQFWQIVYNWSVVLLQSFASFQVSFYFHFFLFWFAVFLLLLLQCKFTMIIINMDISFKRQVVSRMRDCNHVFLFF